MLARRVFHLPQLAFFSATSCYQETVHERKKGEQRFFVNIGAKPCEADRDWPWALCNFLVQHSALSGCKSRRFSRVSLNVSFHDHLYIRNTVPVFLCNPCLVCLFPCLLTVLQYRLGWGGYLGCHSHTFHNVKSHIWLLSQYFLSIWHLKQISYFKICL